MSYIFALDHDLGTDRTNFKGYIHTNLQLGARILTAEYLEVARGIGEGFAALDAAFSLYNTGSPTAGFRNGYVADVHVHAPQR